ncbi:hypothetical protein D9M68_479480 [compost metagenome]
MPLAQCPGAAVLASGTHRMKPARHSASHAETCCTGLAPLRKDSARIQQGFSKDSARTLHCAPTVPVSASPWPCARPQAGTLAAPRCPRLLARSISDVTSHYAIHGLAASLHGAVPASGAPCRTRLRRHRQASRARCRSVPSHVRQPYKCKHAARGPFATLKPCPTRSRQEPRNETSPFPGRAAVHHGRTAFRLHRGAAARRPAASPPPSLRPVLIVGWIPGSMIDCLIT